MSKRKVCVFGTFHGYQFKVPRQKYLTELQSLIEVHSVDLVAEEATGIPGESYIQSELSKDEFKGRVLWKNVDMTPEERVKMPDINPMGLGTLVDLDLQVAREQVWVARTAEAMKNSALLICGLAHTFSVAEKFRSAGFDVETNLYLDPLDDPKDLLGRQGK